MSEFSTLGGNEGYEACDDERPPVALLSSARDNNHIFYKRQEASDIGASLFSSHKFHRPIALCLRLALLGCHLSSARDNLLSYKKLRNHLVSEFLFTSIPFCTRCACRSLDTSGSGSFPCAWHAMPVNRWARSRDRNSCTCKHLY